MTELNGKISWTHRFELYRSYFMRIFFNKYVLLYYYTQSIGGWIHKCGCGTAKSLQSCLTLCDPIDSSPPGSPVPGILQARTLEWVAISFSHAWKGKVKVKSLSRVQLPAIPWTTAHQAPPPMGFSRQEYWSGCHCLLRGCGKPTEELHIDFSSVWKASTLTPMLFKGQQFLI